MLGDGGDLGGEKGHSYLRKRHKVEVLARGGPKAMRREAFLVGRRGLRTPGTGPTADVSPTRKAPPRGPRKTQNSPEVHEGRICRVALSIRLKVGPIFQTRILQA